MRLLQVCNVGRIVGGTAACAWTVTRALPDCEHHVAFLSSVTDDTARVFQPHRRHQWRSVDDDAVRRIRPDVVLLHNVSGDRCSRIRSAWTVQYVHSRGRRAAADRTLFCSRWLAKECKSSGRDATTRVLHQAVPKPPRPLQDERRELRETPVVGRLCTPGDAKWPKTLLPFYSRLAASHRNVDWEFVGCPEGMQRPLAEACHGRVRFLAASWEARRHLWRWDAVLYHHPTLTESFGRIVAEAMRAGCVPIVDARGGFLEQVTPETGWLCASASEFDVALAALSCRTRWRTMSRAALAHADDVFSLARFRRDLLTRLCD